MEQYRKSPRASFIDYDSGAFFITDCTRGRARHFGEITGSAIHLSAVGEFVDSQLRRASALCPGIEVPLYAVMPNHIHAIVCLSPVPGSESIRLNQRAANPSLRDDPDSPRHIPALSRYVNSLKGSVTKFARARGIDFAWHGRYHDHMIRSSRDANDISEYIANNVARWEKDCFF